MVKLIVGVKGTGKTKMLIEMVHDSLETSKGSVVCIEKSNKLRYDINYRCRLIEAEEYMIDDAQSLYGFVAGIIASDHDLTDLYIDSALRIAREDIPSFESLVLELDRLSDKYGFNVVITASAAPEKFSEALHKYFN
ncbi:MAG: hypothetical protein II192_06155 [Clostridia bacterium]|nr:hypothetical protein [Clostridia bacterium]